MVLSVQMMCDWLSMKDLDQKEKWANCSSILRKSIEEVYKNSSPKVLTPDIEGSTGNLDTFSKLLFQTIENTKN